MNGAELKPGGLCPALQPIGVFWWWRDRAICANLKILDIQAPEP